ncbi:MAG: protein kinase domain-containing protein [Acidiferrobacterales bacterium]
MKDGIYKKDWFLASALSVVFVLAVLLQANVLQDFEQVMYDSGISLTHRQPGNASRIAIVAIDDQSIDELGAWPWSRNLLARMLDRLSKAKARVIGLQVDLTQEQGGNAIKQVNKLKNYLYKHPIRNRSQRNAVGSLVYGLENILKGDSHLAQSIARARNVILPMHFTIHTPKKGSGSALPNFLTQNRLSNIVKSKKAKAEPLKAASARYPVTSFGDAALAVGFANVPRDSDNGTRTSLLALDYYGQLYPSLPLLLASKSLYLRTSRIKVNLDNDTFQLASLKIKTDQAMRMYPAFYSGKNNASAFDTYSFVDVLNGKVSLSKFRNRIVIIGQTAFNVGSRYATPINSDMTEPELTANFVTSILNQDFYIRPNWTMYAELLLIVGVWIYLALLFPRISPGLSIFLSALAVIGLLVTGMVMLLGQKVWLQTVTPAVLLIVGHVALTARGIITGERHSIVAGGDSAETNRMLGLTFQSQGQLDMAMDKFRKLPIDDSVLELVYNLALDFERKRQFNKACAAYDYIIGHKPRFRDVKERKKRAQQVEGTMLIGGGTVVLDTGGANPTLGRYVVEQELGRGAMGIVYLGKDPKINRTVAIKTLDLSAEFEPNEIENVKERFFREAETAGRLNHPGIVTIFDAGEEHDLAYIAMEFLEGEDLSEILVRTKKTDPAWVLHIISEAADALDYAHNQDVVHRDIKPANIMYNKSDQSIKITDFGIARITASNRTKTGVVLGTPSYMSPEQLSGKHIDGRSDLFSLGVMMFEMLTGEQPFGGDSLASLMYQITNEKHPDINKLREDLPRCIKPIIDKALQKDPKKRFQTGAEFKEAVDKCWESF